MSRMTISGSRTSAAAASWALTSVRMRRPVSGVAAFSSWDMRCRFPLESARLVPLAELVPHDDGGQVQQHHDDEEEDGRGVDHGLGRLHVGALEAHVVDVEAQVHELPVEVE